MSKEPAVIISTVTAFVTAGIGLGVAFGLDISDAQQTAILAMLAATVTLIMALGPIIRTFVYAPETTQALVDNAVQAGATDSPAPVVQP